MDWPSPVPLSADDDTGTTWQVRRAWPVATPGDYVLEARHRERPDSGEPVCARGASSSLRRTIRGCRRMEAQKGVVVSYRPYRQALIRAPDQYIKVFQPLRAVIPAERCAQTEILLNPGTFMTPKILSRSSPGVTVVSPVPGLTMPELGRNGARVCDEMFAGAWEKWSLAWIAQQHSRYGRAAHGDLHAKQIIATGGTSPPGLLDFDSTARAEAARDLAGLDVHLELDLRQGLMAPARYLIAHAMVLAVAEELRVGRGRFDAYADAIWLRLASSPLRALRPGQCRA